MIEKKQSEEIPIEEVDDDITTEAIREDLQMMEEKETNPIISRYV